MTIQYSSLSINPSLSPGRHLPIKSDLKSVMRFCLSSLNNYKELVFILSFLKNVARLSTTHFFEAASLIYRIILDLHSKSMFIGISNRPCMLEASSQFP